MKYFFYQKIPIWFILCLVTLFPIGSCKSESQSLSECGCDSKTIGEFPPQEKAKSLAEVQKTGYLYYRNIGDEKKVIYIKDKEYSNRFWISIGGNSGCGKFDGCLVNFIVCNESFLKDYQFLKNTDKAVPIYFEGKLKNTCPFKTPFSAPTLFSCQEIVLTSITNK